MSQLTNTPDLARTAPRSPLLRLGGFAILARTIDKCRADIQGRIGDYHFNCPLDVMLFTFKNIDGHAFRDFVATDATDEDIVGWVRANGDMKTDEEIATWSDTVSSYAFEDAPDKAAWLESESVRLGLDPKSTTLFQMLEADDKASFVHVN